MENNRLARKVLSVLLDTEVLDVSLQQQETHLADEKRGLSLFRLDFKALIREGDGTEKTVLIELQKSKYITDIQRFRNYLGASYMTKIRESAELPGMVEEKPAEYRSIYPLITIYILGYNLDDLPYMAVTVNRDITDSVNKEKIEVKSYFIEHLTHQSHIIQVRRLPEKRQSMLEKFLVLFDQQNCTGERYLLELPAVPEEFSDIAAWLQAPVMDDQFRRNLEAEEELDTIFDAQEARHLAQIAEANREKEEANREKEEANREKEEANREKEEANREKQEALCKLVRQMKKYGATLSEIAAETGLTQEEVKEVLSD
jgi:hypothetical protein